MPGRGWLGALTAGGVKEGSKRSAGGVKEGSKRGGWDEVGPSVNMRLVVGRGGSLGGRGRSGGAYLNPKP